MTYLSSSDIARLIHRVHSNASVAIAANCVTTANPKDWASGKVKPTASEMERLVVLGEIVETLVQTAGLKAARYWLDHHMVVVDGTEVSPYVAIGQGEYAIVRRAVHKHPPRKR